MTEETAEDMLRKLEMINQAFTDMTKAQSIILENALTPEFFSANTKFATAKEFFDAAEVDYTQEDFEPPSDAFLQANTQFDTWQELLNVATQHWMLGDPNAGQA